MAFSICLDNIRSAYNVGSIFRTCESADVDTLYLCGITACPPHAGVHKTALGSEERVIWKHTDQTVSTLQQLKQSGNTIVGLEVTTRAQSLFEFVAVPDICLVLGNEVTGLSTEILDICNTVVKVPMFGQKESLNVSVAAGICIYEVKRQLVATATS